MGLIEQDEASCPRDHAGIDAAHRGHGLPDNRVAIVAPGQAGATRRRLGPGVVRLREVRRAGRRRSGSAGAAGTAAVRGRRCEVERRRRGFVGAPRSCAFATPGAEYSRNRAKRGLLEARPTRGVSSRRAAGSRRRRCDSAPRKRRPAAARRAEKTSRTVRRGRERAQHHPGDEAALVVFVHAEAELVELVRRSARELVVAFAEEAPVRPPPMSIQAHPPPGLPARQASAPGASAEVIAPPGSH
jgi:hypothetical protein